MREFRYNFNGFEVFIDVVVEGDVVVTGRFPTPAGAKEFYRKDLDYFLTKKNLSPLTDEEASACLALIVD